MFPPYIPRNHVCIVTRMCVVITTTSSNTTCSTSGGIEVGRLISFTIKISSDGRLPRYIIIGKLEGKLLAS